MLGSRFNVRVKVRVNVRVNVRCEISASALQENIQLHEFDKQNSVSS